jgi:hypothetical protein
MWVVTNNGEVLVGPINMRKFVWPVGTGDVIDGKLYGSTPTGRFIYGVFGGPDEGLVMLDPSLTHFMAGPCTAHEIVEGEFTGSIRRVDGIFVEVRFIDPDTPIQPQRFAPMMRRLERDLKEQFAQVVFVEYEHVKPSWIRRVLRRLREMLD